MHKIGNSIRALRLKHQLTQAQLANELGVQYQTVSKWENGITIPDTMMLPQLAQVFHITIDELFGRTQISCQRPVPHDDVTFLLQTYSQMYAPEAGPWNVSVENKYLMYKFADFFEQHFPLTEHKTICNIGIGAGEWDIYLSYKLKSGSLTSIDKLEVCCRQLQLRLLYEDNPNDVTVICSDVMALNLDRRFDIVTMVGSTLIEGRIGVSLLEKAISFVTEGGSLYYQSIDETEDCNSIIQIAFHNGMRLGAFLEDHSHGFHCHYYKFIK